MSWRVVLIGDFYLLKSLCTEINTSEELSIFEEDGHFFMTSKEFDIFTSAEEVRHVAIEMIKMINGISYHLYKRKGTICSISISKPNSLGGNDLFVFPEPDFLHLTDNQPSITLTNEDGSLIKSSQQKTIHDLLKVAENNSNKAKLFRLFANGIQDWVSLYRVYEVVYSDIGDQIFSWINKNTIKNFKHTCNSIGAIGDAARHGFEITNPPRNPMTMNEAQEMITLIIDKYLEIK